MWLCLCKVPCGSFPSCGVEVETDSSVWEPRGEPFRLTAILTWFDECVYAVCVLCAYVCLPQWQSFPNSFWTHWQIGVTFEDMDLRNNRLLEVFWKLGSWLEEKALSLWCCRWGKGCITHTYIQNPKWKCKCVGNQAINFAVSFEGFLHCHLPFHHTIMLYQNKCVYCGTVWGEKQSHGTAVVSSFCPPMWKDRFRSLLLEQR